MLMKNMLLISILLLAFWGIAHSQTTLNPDISLIGDIRAFSHDDKARPEEKEELNLADPEIELMVSGYLNPYVRADAVFAWHGEHNAEIEEAYATVLRGLPLGMNLRVGKYLLEFGRLNPVHPHAWSFIQRPLPHQYFFGEEGLNDMSVRASFLLPTGSAYTELMGGLLKGDALSGHAHEHEEEAEEEHAEIKKDFGFFGRLATSLALTENAELAIGGSILNAVYAVTEPEVEEETPDQLRTWIGGVDIKYKYKPSRYTAFQMEAEGLIRSAEKVDGGNLNSYGGYGYVDYRFRQKYSAGGIFEYIHLKELHEGETEVEENNAWRTGVFLGFWPVEETSLVRLVGHYTDPGEGDSFWEATLQLIFSLGPHQPHNF